MASGVLYLDSSALVKLVSLEAESAAILELLEQYPDRASSALAATEVRRAARRQTDKPEVLERAEILLQGLTLIPLGPDLLKTAGELDPPQLRSLDAIHLASALYLGDDLAAFVAYDRRLADAARAAALTVSAPGQPQDET